MTHADDPRLAPLLAEVGPEVLPGLPGPADEARAELRDLLADWLREAGHDADSPAVVALLRKEYLAAQAVRSPAERRDLLRAESLERSVRRLGVATLALASGVVDKTVAVDEARARGKELMAELDALGPRFQAVTDPQRAARLRDDIQEARLEALYAVDGKIMSLRLARHARDAAAPNVRP
jgi:hypothetical protein